MRCRYPWFISSLLIALVPSVQGWQSQSSDPVETARDGVILTKLFDPTFPPLAKVARVSGDVVLRLDIRADGQVQSVAIVSGPPMLQQAAKDSAQQSRFECRSCSRDTTQYSLTYSFRLGEGDCDTANSDPPKIAWAQGHVTVTSSPMSICDPAATLRRVRSAKCLYVWRCGLR
jgi:TonB family protein